MGNEQRGRDNRKVREGRKKDKAASTGGNDGGRARRRWGEMHCRSALLLENSGAKQPLLRYFFVML